MRNWMPTMLIFVAVAACDAGTSMEPAPELGVIEGDEARAMMLTHITGDYTTVEDVRRMGKIKADRTILEWRLDQNPEIRNQLEETGVLAWLATEETGSEATTLQADQECDGDPTLTQVASSMFPPSDVANYYVVQCQSTQESAGDARHQMTNTIEIRSRSTGGIVLISNDPNPFPGNGCGTYPPPASAQLWIPKSFPEISLLCALSKGTHATRNDPGDRDGPQYSANPDGCVDVAGGSVGPPIIIPR